MKSSAIILMLVFGLTVSPLLFADSPQQVNVDFKGKPERVNYDFYIPPHEPGVALPVLVCVGGLPIIDGKYVYSDTRECRDERWKKFADENNIIILGLGFLFDEAQWKEKTSYQYPAAWSGQALFDILNIIAQKVPVKTNDLFLFGISAGAQFANRVAQLYPDKVTAVAAHAAGGYDLPQTKLPAKFLITVGERDNGEITRREMAEQYFAACQKQGISIELKIIPGIAHRQTEEQNEMSRQFFREVLAGDKKKSCNCAE